MRDSRWITYAVWAAALVAGVIAAFATAGPALFADGDNGERMVVLGVSVLLFAVLGALAGLLAPSGWKGSGIALIVPLVLVTVVFGLEMPLLAVIFLLADAAAALLGAWTGARLRGRAAVR